MNVTYSLSFLAYPPLPSLLGPSTSFLQRPYSWRTKQVYELIQDLVTAYRAGQEYFLGAIVTTKTEDTRGAPYQV